MQKRRFPLLLFSGEVSVEAVEKPKKCEFRKIDRLFQVMSKKMIQVPRFPLMAPTRALSNSESVLHKYKRKSAPCFIL
jgi:hypothetical protein